jgi:hypothetical protein
VQILTENIILTMQYINNNNNNNNNKSEPIQIKRGIYQGDSLSPLWFCLAINPLTNLLNSTGYGFNIRLFLTLISYTVSMVHLSSYLMFPIKYACLYKTRRQ